MSEFRTCLAQDVPYFHLKQLSLSVHLCLSVHRSQRDAVSDSASSAGASSMARGLSREQSLAKNLKKQAASNKGNHEDLSASARAARDAAAMQEKAAAKAAAREALAKSGEAGAAQLQAEVSRQLSVQLPQPVSSRSPFAASHARWSDAHAMELLDWLIVLSLLGFIFAGNRRAASEKKSVAVSAPLHRWQRIQPVSRQFAGAHSSRPGSPARASSAASASATRQTQTRRWPR